MKKGRSSFRLHKSIKTAIRMTSFLSPSITVCGSCTKSKRAGEITFITTKDVIGRKTYRRSVTLLMQKALYNLLGKEKSTVYVKHCISQAYYCELVQYGRPDEAFLQKLKEEMLKMAEEQIPIYKECIGTDEAVELFHRLGMPQKNVCSAIAEVRKSIHIHWTDTGIIFTVI